MYTVNADPVPAEPDRIVFPATWSEAEGVVLIPTFPKNLELRSSVIVKEAEALVFSILKVVVAEVVPVPTTCNLAEGEAVPIPTFPFDNAFNPPLSVLAIFTIL